MLLFLPFFARTQALPESLKVANLMEGRKFECSEEKLLKVTLKCSLRVKLKMVIIASIWNYVGRRPRSTDCRVQHNMTHF